MKQTLVMLFALRIANVSSMNGAPTICQKEVRL
jgi:hypothetical protein